MNVVLLNWNSSAAGSSSLLLSANRSSHFLFLVVNFYSLLLQILFFSGICILQLMSAYTSITFLQAVGTTEHTPSESAIFKINYDVRRIGEIYKRKSSIVNPTKFPILISGKVHFKEIFFPKNKSTITELRTCSSYHEDRESHPQIYTTNIGTVSLFVYL